ncbi:MAG: Smr/MutS family protein [Deltaproteobacteria bacterium]|nr:Smr/MutS family protein [Deltaproteobacteria bacterium]
MHQPFADLDRLLDKKRKTGRKKETPARAAPCPAPKAKESRAVEDDEALFAKAMEGVTPLDSARAAADEPRASRPAAFKGEDEEAAARRALEELVAGRSGMNISLTDEYVEGAAYGTPPSVPKRLHKGEFSIQAHLDLHGMAAEDAKEAFEGFMEDAVRTGKRAVCIIHGRGLSSKKDPVLKSLVLTWLTRGPWRKWVPAFASARACDGGTGATYLLLRTRPVTKKDKKAGRDLRG